VNPKNFLMKIFEGRKIWVLNYNESFKAYF